MNAICTLQLQIKECLESAKEVVKYYRNKTVMHGLLDNARKYVKVSNVLLQIPSQLSSVSLLS